MRFLKHQCELLSSHLINCMVRQQTVVDIYRKRGVNDSFVVQTAESEPNSQAYPPAFIVASNKSWRKIWLLEHQFL